MLPFRSHQLGLRASAAKLVTCWCFWNKCSCCSEVYFAEHEEAILQTEQDVQELAVSIQKARGHVCGCAHGERAAATTWACSCDWFWQTVSNEVKISDAVPRHVMSRQVPSQSPQSPHVINFTTFTPKVLECGERRGRACQGGPGRRDRARPRQEAFMLTVEGDREAELRETESTAAQARPPVLAPEV